MSQHNAANERIKREYFIYLKEAKRYSTPSIDAAAAAISSFEGCTHHRDFKAFRIEQAIAFKRKLSEKHNLRTGRKLSKATLYSTLQALRNFFLWLASRPGFKSRLSYSDADYFNLSDKETRIAKAHREVAIPTLEQIHHVISQMPSGSDIEKRNQALIALVILTGVRDGALASLRLKHIDLEQGRIIQDAREVNTKFSKTFSTWFFPVGGSALEIVTNWINFLRTQLLWGDDDPLFPATQVGVGKTQHFEALGLKRTCWTNAGPIRKIFRAAFEDAGLPYFHPHLFRKTLVQLGQRRCGPPEEFKAWSQNLGHDQVLTTFTSYGAVTPDRQAEVIRSFGHTHTLSQLDDVIVRLARLEERQA